MSKSSFIALKAAGVCWKYIATVLGTLAVYLLLLVWGYLSLSGEVTLTTYLVQYSHRMHI